MTQLDRVELDSLRSSRIFVAGHRGMVGSAIVRLLEQEGCKSILARTRTELDLTDPHQVARFMRDEQPQYVFLAAAKVGGIHANNTEPATFILDNLLIAANVIRTAHDAGVHRLMFLGSSCIYPRLAPQPMSEDMLLTGVLEPTNEPYAIAKIAGIKLCESYNRQHGTDFRSLMPTNLYGPNDNFDLNSSHVLPALIRKFHDAKQAGDDSVTVWGTGKPEREFLHVDDLADASVFAMCLPRAQYSAVTTPMCSHLNAGTGIGLSIGELAETIRDVVGFDGAIVFDSEKPDGTPRKLLDVRKMNALGWTARISLDVGIADTYDWFKRQDTTTI